MSLWTAQRPSPADASATEIIGQLMQLRQVFDNPDGTFTVVGDLEDRSVVRGPIEARGELVPGSRYRFLGKWREHDRYGWQFAFDAALLETPDDPDGITAYLHKHAERVGLVTAAKLVAAYGSESVRVLIDDVERVIADEVMGRDDAVIASTSLKQVYADPALREAHLQLFSLLRGHGFYGKAIKAALRKWRSSAPAQVRRDPFLLMTHSLPGCGFLRCDRLYLALKKNPRRLKRQALAAWYALSMLDGDTWADVTAALSAVRTQIGGTQPRDKRACALLHRAGLAESRTDEQGRVWIAERYKAASERACAVAVRKLQQGEASWPIADTLGLNPETDAHQIAELAKALTSRVCLLTGSPGTGKTHCLAQVIRGTIKMVGAAKVAVCAPTGKAAVRISEKLQEAKLPIKATTIHSLLKVAPVESGQDGWGFEHGPDNPLPFSHLFVDETSMMDVGLAAYLLRALTGDVQVLFVGDPHQLPPVGHGAFLRDLIAAGVARGTLSEIRRNAGRIVTACHEIKDGKTPKISESVSVWPMQNLIQLPWPKSDKPRDKDQAIKERLEWLYEWLMTLPQFAQWQWSLLDDVQVICARNATREQLNDHLQGRLNAAGEKGPVGKFRVGDKVICLKNGFCIDAEDRNHKQVYVANGDMGRVKSFRGKHAVVKLTSPDRLVLVPLTKAAEDQQEAHAVKTQGEAGRAAGGWDLAFAITVHKSQGSEYPVIIFLVEGAGKLGSRELAYTAISRARELCVVLGDVKDLKRYISNVTLPQRKTFLRELVTGELK